MLSIYLAMVESDSDKELVSCLYKKYKAYLFSVSLSILHSRSDAEDAVHETFVRIINNLSKIKDIDSDKTKSFITVITRNICYDMIRRDSRREYTDENELDTYLSSSDVIKETEAKLDYETVVKNISRLTPALKNISTLYFVLQYSASEISEILSISENAVYSAISRSRKILAEKQQKGDAND